jgi:hypothetical protein
MSLSSIGSRGVKKTTKPMIPAVAKMAMLNMDKPRVIEFCEEDEDPSRFFLAKFSLLLATAKNPMGNFKRQCLTFSTPDPL